MRRAEALAVGTVRTLRWLQGLSSMSCDDDGCVIGTSFALGLAWDFLILLLQLSAVPLKSPRGQARSIPYQGRYVQTTFRWLLAAATPTADPAA